MLLYAELPHDGALCGGSVFLRRSVLCTRSGILVIELHKGVVP